MLDHKRTNMRLAKSKHTSKNFIGKVGPTGSLYTLHKIESGVDGLFWRPEPGQATKVIEKGDCGAPETPV